MDGQTLLNLGLVVAFILLGGIFAATEIALVSLRESQVSALEQRGGRGARVAAVARDPNRFLAAVQIGVTVAGFFSAAYGGAAIAPDLAPYLQDWGLSESAAQTTALIVMTLFIAYLSLVLGELVPKRIALQRSSAVSLAVAPVLDRFATLMRPVIWLLSVSTNALVRVLGGDPSVSGEELSEGELRELVTTHDALDDQERRLLRDVFAATDATVKEVMRPRGDVTFLAADLPLTEAAERVRTLPYSRYPVTGASIDDVRGVVHVRELLGLPVDDTRTAGDIAMPALLLPGSKALLPSVALMREQGRHLAIVVDEYGGTDGIVTLEDLVEELVGDIRDEYDVATTPNVAGQLVNLDAGMSLEDFREITGIALTDGPYETVAGYVVAGLGRLAAVGDVVELEGGGRLTVSAVAGNRVTRIDVLPPTD